MSDHQEEMAAIQRELDDVKRQMAELRYHCGEICSDLAMAVKQALEYQKQIVADVHAMQGAFMVQIGTKLDEMFGTNPDQHHTGTIN